MIRKLLPVLALFICASVHAGTCPSGANYLNTTAPAGSLVTLASLNITSCFFIAANGLDTNTGADETHPWLHAPGMSSCASNCAGNTPSGGSGYIFRGGDTWHEGNSGSAPYTNGWFWAWNGTSATTPIYIGVDSTWYSGGSWSRPILNGDNALNGCYLSGPCPVSSCTYGDIGGEGTSFMFRDPGYDWIVFDDFEFTGMCWSTNGGLMLSWYSANSGTLEPYFFVPERNYFHGWTYTTAGDQTNGGALAGNGSYPGAVVQFNLIDGSDSDSYALSPFGSSNTDIYILRYNISNYDGGDTVSNDCHYIHDNVFENFSLTSDATSHGDIPFCEAGGITVTGSGPNLWFNNVWINIGIPHNGNISYLPSEAEASGHTAYLFNNVWGNNQPGAGGDYFDDEGNAGSKVLFNNTAERMTSSSNTVIQTNSTTSINNHWISTPANQATIFGVSPTSESDPVYMTNSAATTQGYVTANNFAPTAETNSTVGAGTNESSECADSVLHYAIAETECMQGITGVSENASNHTVTYPANSPVARPSTGAWDVGAYEYSNPFVPGTIGCGFCLVENLPVQ